MIAYLDASVVLRFVLGQPDRLAEWKSIDEGVASALLEVECLRTLDRLRLRTGLAEGELVARREKLYEILESLEILEVSHPVLARAAQAFPASLGTLDAIHLATALLWNESRSSALVLATHDDGLGRAARACGLRVIGTAKSRSPLSS